MAKKPNLYTLKVNRPIEAFTITFRPDAEYTVKPTVYEALKEKAADAIASADPIYTE